MKPFNLEDAKKGVPVCTRNGKPARIICFDRNHKDYPIVALVMDTCGGESNMTFTLSGKYDTSIAYDGSLDLMMTSSKHNGWINIYRLGETIKRQTGEIYDTEEEAIKHIDDFRGYITTQHIEWEE